MKTNRSLHRFALLVTGSTLILIFAGGLVTSTGSGLAIPDWPLSFGVLFPEMEGGAAYEHGHRMIAGIVGLLTIALAVWLRLSEPRRWVRLLGLLAVIAVILQALLGGATVLYRLPLALSVGHAALAQIFLCLTAAIALCTSETWQRQAPRIYDPRRPSIRTLAVLAPAAILLQTIFGAFMRHLGGGLSIPDFPLAYGRLIPPFFTGPILFNYAHRVAGLLVLLLVFWLCRKVIAAARSDKTLRTPAWVLAISLTAQILLGAVTIWSQKAAIPTTLHVACGALTLATCLWLTMNVLRNFQPVPDRAGRETAGGAVA